MIEFLVKRRKITILFFVMAVLIGFLSFFQLPKQESPDVIINVALVTTVMPGASPEKVEQTVTKKLEQRIKELQGIKSIESTSAFGYSVIVVEAASGVDPAQKWDELRKKVKDAEADLPTDAKQPVINDDLAKAAFYTFNITANQSSDLYQLRYVLKNWKDQLGTLPGVSQVNIVGLPDQEVRIDLDSNKLRLYNIAWAQVLSALQGQNDRIPIGEMKVEGTNYQLKLPDTYKLDELNQIVIGKNEQGVPVHLQDVGRAYLTTKETSVYAYHNGKPALVMGIGVEKRTDAPSTQKNIDQMIGKLKTSLPSGVTMEPVFSQCQKVDKIFNNLLKEMIFAILAVLFVCTLGLSFSTAAMVALAIPISMAIGLIFLPYMNITISEISVYGLIVVLGILVDDAVVVNDNIERHLSVLKQTPFTAAIEGAREVALSILTATLSTVFAFGPLLFLTGIMGDFIRPMPVVISLTMLASMIMSLTIIPIFRYWYEDRRLLSGTIQDKPAGLLGQQLTRLTDYYAHTIIPKILKRPLRTGVIGVLIGTLAYGLVPFIPVELFPEADWDQMPIFIQMPVGTTLNETEQVVAGIRQFLSEQKGVLEVYSSSGGQVQGWFGGPIGADSVAGNTGFVVVKLDNKQVKQAELVDTWGQTLSKKYPGVEITPYQIKSGPPVGKAISLNLYGDDVQTLRALSQQVKDKISKVPGAVNVQDNFGLDAYTLEFQVNNDMMKQKMVSYTDLSRTLRLVSEGITVGNYDDGNDLIDMLLYAKDPNSDPMAVFQSLSVPNAKGEQIPLLQLARVKPAFGIMGIPHRNLSRVVTITGDAQGRTATEVMTDIQGLLTGIKFPEGYRWDVGGEMNYQSDMFSDLGKLSIFVFFLIFIQIAIQFYSLSLPLLVMSTVYLAVAGSLIGLFSTRTPLGFVSMMGMIALAGIVVRNGIVFIEFIERSRKAGHDLEEAVQLAGGARLRPILLTSATAVAGLTPLAFAGEPLFTPLATTIISGLVFSTLLTLLVVPSLYTALAQWKLKRENRRMERIAGFSETNDVELD
ncbi:MAG TPA: efflux RND transporter permease subunit [Syntrophomonadaceae bacterium]|nr:efflux RND transporter permease subunit [Syntrophomonadaceae bacterium]